MRYRDTGLTRHDPGTVRRDIALGVTLLAAGGPAALVATHHYLILAALITLVGLAVFYSLLLSSSAARRNRARTLRWRIRLRLRPGRGYASAVQLGTRWGRLAAVRHGRRARPSLSLRTRLTSPPTDYAVRLGRAQRGHRVFSRMEDQVLVLSPQRMGKTGLIADRIVDHPGAVLATSTRADLLQTTGADRGRRGQVHVFNPQGVGGAESTLRFDLLGPCRDLEMAMRMATWLSGGAAGSGHGNMEWFERKGDAALGGLLLAGAYVPGATIADVFRWVQLDGYQVALEALARYGTPEVLSVVRRALADNRTAGSVRDTIELNLAWAAIPELAASVTPLPGQAPFDAETFALGRETLYMIASGDENSPVTPLFRALASYVHYVGGLVGTRQPAGRLDPPILMALDELTQVCPIDLPAMLADSAGKGILIQPVVHGVSQLKDQWGEAGAATVWACCGTKMLLPSITDDDTLETVSKLCGTVSAGGDGDNDHQVRVVPPELIRTLPDWRALILRMNLDPVAVKFRPVWKRPGRRFPLRYFTRRPQAEDVAAALPEPVDAPGPAEVYQGDLPLQPQAPAAWPRNANGHDHYDHSSR